MLSRKPYVPPMRLIDVQNPEPVDWREAYKSQLDRTKRLELQVNRLQASIKDYFDWLNRPGALNIGNSGVYTPTLTEAGVNNISGTPSVKESRWIQAGEVVFVTGSALITSIDAAITTTFTLNLPVASTVGAYDASGIVNSFYTTCGAGTVTGNSATVICNYDVTSVAGAETVTWAFSYKVI